MGEGAAVELYKAYYDKGTSAGKRICEDALAAKATAGTEVSPVGIIGYYYPATVYVAENGMLYCVHEYESDFVYLQMLKKFLPMNCRCTGRYG